jgi:hypothetical protein
VLRRVPGDKEGEMTKSELIQCLDEALDYYVIEAQNETWSSDVRTLFAGYVLAYDRVLRVLQVIND